MGDGRYYTWVQFCNILILTLSLMFIAIGVTFFYLKSRIHYSKSILVFSGILICISLIFVLLDEAVHLLNLSRFFKTSFISIFFVLVYLRLWHLTVKYLNYMLNMLIKIFSCVIVSAIILNPLHDWFFSVYDFNIIQTSLYFDILIIFTLFLLLIFSIVDIYLKYNEYDFKSSIFVNTAIFIQTTAVFIYFLNLHSNCYKLYIYIIPATLFFISLAVLKYSPEFYLPNSYRDAVGNLNELILICNRHGKIVYSNKNFFISQIDLSKNVFKNSIDSIFKGFSGFLHEETENQLEYRLYNNNKEYIINVYVHKLCEHKSDGCVYRIVDKTPFYDNLRVLREKNEYLNLVNKELLNYSQEVERLDCEKERNKLLFDVQNILGHKVSELIKMLESVENIDTNLTYYLNTIEHAIKNSRECLRTIRETVNKFKESYEVKKID